MDEIELLRLNQINIGTVSKAAQRRLLKYGIGTYGLSRTTREFVISFHILALIIN